MQSNPTVAYVRGYHGDAEAHANGYLIAAAPDLLAVCGAIEAHCKRGAPVAEGQAIRAQLQAAIAKATAR